MESATHTIFFDPARNLVRVELRGFWDTAAALRYRGDLVRIVREGARSGADIFALSDLRGMMVQSPETLHMVGEMLDDPTLPPPKRMAILVEKALFRRQVVRLLRDNHRVFGTEPEALEWLFSG